MSTVLLISSETKTDHQHAHLTLDRIRQSSLKDRIGKHQTTEHPEEADIILFAERGGSTRHHESLRNHPVARDFREKCFMFTVADHPLPTLPGIFAGTEKRWYKEGWVRTGFYPKVFADAPIPEADRALEPRHLFSFSGAVHTHPVRSILIDLPAKDAFLRDTSGFYPYHELTDEQRQELRDSYRESLLLSRYVLCPRGRSPNSIRLFEAMKAGRVPVIVSDEWVPPTGPDWDSFSIRVAEKDAGEIPTILRGRKDEWASMANKARSAFESWYAEDVAFSRIVDWCLEIDTARQSASFMTRLNPTLHALRPHHLKYALRKTLARS